MVNELSLSRGRNRPALPAKASNDIPEAIRAYAAGFVDGEGSIAIRKLKPENMPRRASPDYGIHIQVANSHRGVLDFLCSYFGGHVYELKHWKGQDNGWKPRFVWILYERQAYYLLTLLTPRLQVKKQHAQVCLEFYETRRHKPSQTRLSLEEVARSEKYYLAMKALNKRGAQYDN